MQLCLVRVMPRQDRAARNLKNLSSAEVTLRDGTAKVSVTILAEIAGPVSCHFDRRLPSQ